MPNPPKPTALRVLHGNPGNQPVRGDEPQPRKSTPTPPDWLAPEALAEWERIVPELARVGLLTVVDRAALIVYCEAWARYVDATKVIQEQGPLITGYRGSDVRNPAALVAKDAEATIRAFCHEFGLSPSARARMVVPGETPTDAGAGILTG